MAGHLSQQRAAGPAHVGIVLMKQVQAACAKSLTSRDLIVPLATPSDLDTLSIEG